MEFQRVGGLSPVKYARTNTSFEYHWPPVRKGIYAFIWPYFDPYFVCWSARGRRELQLRGIRRFRFEGELYTHLGCTGSPWQLIHTCELPALLKADQHACRVSWLTKLGLDQDWRIDRKFLPELVNSLRIPYYMISRDHLEVFIPKRELGKIR